MNVVLHYYVPWYCIVYRTHIEVLLGDAHLVVLVAQVRHLLLEDGGFGEQGDAQVEGVHEAGHVRAELGRVNVVAAHA